MLRMARGPWNKRQEVTSEWAALGRQGVYFERDILISPTIFKGNIDYLVTIKEYRGKKMEVQDSLTLQVKNIFIYMC